MVALQAPRFLGLEADTPKSYGQRSKLPNRKRFPNSPALLQVRANLERRLIIHDEYTKPLAHNKLRAELEIQDVNLSSRYPRKPASARMRADLE